jgi:tRNA (guanine-N7-)-methyltransferase
MDQSTQPSASPLLDYHATSFSAGKMAFAWEEWTEEERRKAYANWAIGRGLIGGDPRQRPGATKLPVWGIDRPFFRALALEDSRGANKERLTTALAAPTPLEIEIGYGRGDFLLDRATQHPDRLFVGYETKTKTTRLCLARIERFQIQNLWLSDDDCRFNLPRIIPDGRVNMIHILFPDPWWKPQHKHKRLFSPPFVDLVAAKLQSGGLLHFKSDVEEYGKMVCALVETHPDFTPHAAEWAEQIGSFAPTHREYWCQQHGRPVFAYYFQRR